MLDISNKVALPERDIEIKATGAQGPGGQNVNKVATAIELRLDIVASSLPDWYKHRLLNRRDRRITKDGVIVIKAQRYRSREKNVEDARQRLTDLIRSVSVVRKERNSSRVPPGERRRRLEGKRKRGRVKQQRRRPSDSE